MNLTGIVSEKMKGTSYWFAICSVDIMMKEDIAKMQFPKTYLIIVPHPDDEINVAGQLIYHLTQSLNKVYVLFTTNGDYIYQGKKRLKEAINALKILGVDEENIIFMGYGDDWKGKKHIYNQEDDIALESMGGRKQTYALETHQDYRFMKSGYHHAYTRKNYKRDMTDVIFDILADVLIVVDFDWHPDHRSTSLMFEEIMGGILKTKDDYKPVVLKKFAYAGVWDGPKDYYKVPKEATCLPPKQLVNDAGFELDIPAYSWYHRIRFEAPKETQTRLIKKNIIFKAEKEHKTQNAKWRVDRICSADIVYWLRKTNSLSYQAKITVSSGNSTFLNDFKLIDCPNVETEKKGIRIFGECIWIPDKSDQAKMVKFTFQNPVDISCISFYESFHLKDHIKNGIIQFDNGYRIETGPFDNTGKETIVEFKTQYDIQWLSFQIIDFEGDRPGLTELEIYERREKEDLSFISRYYSPAESVNDEVGSRCDFEVFFEQYSIEIEKFLTRVEEKIIRDFTQAANSVHLMSILTRFAKQKNIRK